MNDYHPHYHIIIDGKVTAYNLRESKLKKNPDYKIYWGQDVRQANEKSVKELFKYFTKIYSPPKDVKTEDFEINYEAIDNMVTAIYRKRIFQPIGFKLLNLNEQEKPEKLKKNPYAIYMNDLKDWVNINTGELLTGYKPNEKTRNFVNKM